MKAVILNESGQVLILHKADFRPGIHGYSFPGGKLEVGEPFLDGLKREISEETGLVVRVGEPFFVGEWFPVINGVTTQIVATFFACTTTGREVKLSPEHDEYAWIDPQRYTEYDWMDPEGQVVKAWLARA